MAGVRAKVNCAMGQTDERIAVSLNAHHCGGDMIMCVVHIQHQCREGGVSYPDSDARRGFPASAPECIKRCNSLIAASAMPSSRQLYHVRATQNLFTPLPIRALLTDERACLCSYICMYASISQKLHSGCPSCRPTNSVNHSITPLTKILLQKRQRRNKKLSYRRGTARCVVSIEILPIATQQCRNYLYDKS